MPDCPTPAKRRYATRIAAQRVARQLAASRGRVLHPYVCRCGWTHLTSLAAPENYTNPTTREVA